MKLPARPWLLPFVPLYRAGAAVRQSLIKPKTLQHPVLSIGNLSTGGTGKTPFTIALAQLLCDSGYEIDVLSRGYGRNSKLPAHVDPSGTAAEFGDEPLLMAGLYGLNVFVGASRFVAGQLAESQMSTDQASNPGPLTVTTSSKRIHLLDDGFQHRSLHRDADIVLLSRVDWNDFLLPAGNLREPRAALLRAQVVVLPESDADLTDELRGIGFEGSIWTVRTSTLLTDAIDSAKGHPITGAVICNRLPNAPLPIAAFSGIARPERFFSSLRTPQTRLVYKGAFPDHHPFTEAELRALVESALRAEAKIILTTEKDWVRLGSQRALLDSRLPLRALPLVTNLTDPAAALEWIRSQF